VDVVDDTHVALTFATAQPGFEANLVTVSGMILGQSAIDDAATLGETPAGSGPYTLDDSTVKGSSYVLVKNDASAVAADYAYDSIVFKPITDAQARVNAVISGQADAGFIATSTSSLAEDKGLSLSQLGGTVTSILIFDRSGATSAPFADPNVRLALSYAIDRQELVDGLHPGEVPTNNALPQDNPGFNQDLETDFAFDVDKAKQLLADAGYPEGFSFDVVISAETQTDMQAYQKYFAEIGVTMNLKLASSTEEIFGAVNTQPIGYLPLNWGNPLGAMFGVVLGFADPHKDADPSLQGLTGAVAGAQTDDDRAAALLGLNTALVSTGTIIPVFEQLTTWTYNDTVQPVVFPGQNNVPLLSSFAPAN
jgi:peptide/nickel transport system substrate-binding protein